MILCANSKDVSGAFWPFNYFNQLISTHVSPPIPHPAHQHCQFLLIKRYALLQSADFLFMFFAVPKLSETFLQLGDVDYDCTNRNGIGNLSHTTTLFPKIFKVVLLIRIKISKNRGSSDNPDNKGPKIIRIANFFF